MTLSKFSKILIKLLKVKIQKNNFLEFSQTEALKEKLLILNHIKQNLPYYSHLPNVGDIFSQFSQRSSETLSEDLLEKDISQYSSEELYTIMSIFLPNQNFNTLTLQQNFLNRFFELLQEDIESDSSLVNNDGVISVSKRIIEPHLFSKIVGGFSIYQHLFNGCEGIEKFGENCTNYLRYHSKNISFFDKSLALASLQNFPCPYHRKFFFENF